MSIVSIGAVENVKVNEGSVTVTLNLLVPGLPSKDQIIADCDAALQKLDWVETINVRVQPRTPLNQSGSGVATTLKNVEHVIGVSSCKGGVGKSTVAVNLAVSLAQRGLRVGLLDADVYGPSLPHMLDIDDVKVRKSSINPRHILPIEGPYGLKVMSFGWVNPGAGVAGAGGRQAAILRGPVVTRVINQLVCATEWADIDYLVVDMPPGTGDVQITLAQILPFTGAVIVSTPHRLSLVDAAKGVQMFESLRVPCLAVVENMSYFECRGGERHYPFGRGGRRALIQGLLAGSGDSDDSGSRDSGASGASDGSSSLIQRMREVPFHHLPLTEEVSGYTHTHEAGTGAGACATNEAVHDHNGDGGGDGSGLASGPVVIRQPDSQSAQIYNNLGADVMNEIFKLQINAYMVRKS
jgi:Mrp family chromosome partitioning ATPase